MTAWASVMLAFGEEAQEGGQVVAPAADTCWSALPWVASQSRYSSVASARAVKTGLPTQLRRCTSGNKMFPYQLAPVHPPPPRSGQGDQLGRFALVEEGRDFAPLSGELPQVRDQDVRRRGEAPDGFHQLIGAQSAPAPTRAHQVLEGDEAIGGHAHGLVGPPEQLAHLAAG